MDKNILITGAGSGIGRTTARLFLDEGWHVALVGRHEETLSETAGDDRRALILPADVTEEDSVAGAFVRVAEEWGRLDVLFNNAGTNIDAGLPDEIAVADFRTVIDTNVTGMFLCARAAFGLMRRQSPSGGRIVNNGSISAHVPRPGSAPYSMSKHAVTGLTRSLALDGRPFGISCGQIDIGNAQTEMTERMSQGVDQADGSTRAEPVIDAAHVAASVLHMASLPPEANVFSMTIMARDMPYAGRG